MPALPHDRATDASYAVTQKIFLRLAVCPFFFASVDEQRKALPPNVNEFSPAVKLYARTDESIPILEGEGLYANKATVPGEIILEVEEMEEVIAPGIHPNHNFTPLFMRVVGD